MHRLAAAVLAAFFVSCAAAPVAEPVRFLDAGLCWYEVDQCRDVQIVTGSIVQVCETQWEARCREADLERFLRDGCALTRMPDKTKIAVACGGAR